MSNQGIRYSPTAKSFLYADPHYIEVEKMTFVYIGDERYLGCTSKYAQIKDISWYYDLNKNGNYDTKFVKVTYSGLILKTSFYDNPYPVALKNYNNPIGESLSLKIGNCYFDL